MERTAVVNEIRQQAADVYAWASCTVDEYIDINPGEGVNEYVDALIEANADLSQYDEHDRKLFRQKLVQLANADCHK